MTGEEARIRLITKREELMHKYMFEEAEVLTMAIEALNGRPRGEWADMNGNPVPLNEDGETTNSCWCSECGEWLVASDEYPTKGNFCPNCGAGMRSE